MFLVKGELVESVIRPSTLSVRYWLAPLSASGEMPPLMAFVALLVELDVATSGAENILIHF